MQEEEPHDVIPMPLRYAYQPKAAHAKAYGRALDVSPKNSAVVCRALTSLSVEKGKRLLEGMLGRTASVDGKYFDSVSAALLDLLKQAEQNAAFKGLAADRLVIHASAHEGFAYMRPRRYQLRGKKRLANLQVVLEQR